MKHLLFCLLCAGMVSAQNVEMVEVEPGIRLEVLDWGGEGLPVVFLPGLVNTAHVFDQFAPKLGVSNRLIGITRRGFGASTLAYTDYSSRRLARDVVAVLDHLKIAKAVLVGHSIGGSELSAVGTMFPERVVGLVYLDAAFEYAHRMRAGGSGRIRLRNAEPDAGVW